jgi:hypothetical protein
MSKEDLELSKLNFEVETLRSQLDQTQQEKRKLELEVALLVSQVGRWGTFARVAWPVVSVVLSTAIAVMALIFTLRANGVEAAHNERQEYISVKHNLWETYNTAVHDATDESKGNDGRISGIWTLNDPYFHWNNEYFQTTAHVLVGVLVTGSDDDDPHAAVSKQAVRLGAAQVLGGLTPCEVSQSGQQSPAEAITKFLFGAVDNKEARGIISEAENYLLVRRGQVKDTTAVDLKLAAIRAVVQRYRACFAWADLRGYDLRNTDLSEADLENAGLVAADLQGSDLRGANLRGADMSNANLDGSRLVQTQDWNTSVVKGANINNVEDAPAGFRDWALNQHAVEMKPSTWTTWKMRNFPAPRDWEKWRASGFALGTDGVPVQ